MNATTARNTGNVTCVTYRGRSEFGGSLVILRGCENAPSDLGSFKGRSASVDDNMILSYQKWDLFEPWRNVTALEMGAMAGITFFLPPVFRSLAWNIVGKLHFIDGIMTQVVILDILKENLISSLRNLKIGGDYYSQQNSDPKHMRRRGPSGFETRRLKCFPGQSNHRLNSQLTFVVRTRTQNCQKD
ncbi:hypothetical protein Fcan01_16106 [Folsomia candida]|uniref:Uncharacterized protein n=1 Tax=Folsomia candida TaxID=158441 RepID=A0A226DWY4_FOLCA|nr:hypothetical protein Fcan01_16106 [Folsomia candida]